MSDIYLHILLILLLLKISALEVGLYSVGDDRPLQILKESFTQIDFTAVDVVSDDNFEDFKTKIEDRKINYIFIFNPKSTEIIYNELITSNIDRFLWIYDPKAHICSDNIIFSSGNEYRTAFSKRNLHF